MLALPKTKEEGGYFIQALLRQKNEASDYVESTERYMGARLSGIGQEDADQYEPQLMDDLKEAIDTHKESVAAYRSARDYVEYISTNSSEPAPNRAEILLLVKHSLEFYIMSIEQQIEMHKNSLKEMQAEFDQMEPSEDDSDNGRFRLWDDIDFAEEEHKRLLLILPACWQALKDFTETENAQSLFTTSELDLIKMDDEIGFKALLSSYSQ